MANTFVPAAVVEAFSVASGVLAKMGAGAAAIGGTSISTPVLVGVGALAVVAAGGYCYFQGIPLPIENVLSSAGLGSATKQGFMVSIPQLAIACIVLGGAGYIAYRFYRNFSSVRAARLLGSGPVAPTREQAEATSSIVFGDDAWPKLGASVWNCVDDARSAAAAAARDAVQASAALAEKLIATSTEAAEQARGAMDAAASTVAELVGNAGTHGAAALSGVAGSLAPARQRFSVFGERLGRVLRLSRV